MSQAKLSLPDRAALVDLLAMAHNDPALFATGVLRVERLRAWQARYCGEITGRLNGGERHLKALLRTCHGAGKTFFAAMILLWFMTTRHNARGLTTAPTWSGVEGLLWPEIAKLYNGSLLRPLGLGRLMQTKLDYGKTWYAVGASSDRPENLEGHHSDTAAIRIVDEAKAVPNSVFVATDGLLNAPESLDLWISTPSVEAGEFFERDENGGESVLRAAVDVDQLISDETMDERERLGYLSWKNEKLKSWGLDSAEFQSRIMAKYIDNSEGALFPSSWIERAMQQEFDVETPRVAGLDPAGSVDGDQSALAVASMRDDINRVRVFSVTGWHERDTMVSKSKALSAAHDMRARLRIDSVGLGKGVADAARQNNLGVVVEDYRASDKAREPERFSNRKAEDAWALRILLEQNLVRLPVDDKLRGQMRAMKYEILATGKLRVVDPADSPDLADAVIIATAAPRFGYSTLHSVDF